MTARDVNAAERLRLAVKQRLEALGVTNRAFGKHFGHGDAWANAVLDGRIKLRLSDLDEIAAFLRTTSGDLLRRPDEENWILRPTEMRIVRALRALPIAIRDELAVLIDYLVGVAPDEIEHLTRYRQLKPAERARIDHWVDVTLLSQEPPPVDAVPPGLPGTIGPQPAPTPHIRRGRPR